MKAVFFDDSLRVLLASLGKSFSKRQIEEGVVVRDGTGRLCFVAKMNFPKDTEKAHAISSQISTTLGAYANQSGAVIYGDEFGAKDLLADPSKIPSEYDNGVFYLLDRRIVGSAWMTTPRTKRARPPRIVFASLKGGVGRSTALAVTAANYAAAGKNVLVVDLDLEAPGLGELLLKPRTTPRYGVIDFLVESGIWGEESLKLGEFRGKSWLTGPHGGRVDVVPALGHRSNVFPGNILPKLSRAMLDSYTSNGETHSVGAKISNMIDLMTESGEYDAVLVDSRAGLAELSAPAVLGLGGLVLLFGTAQKQTISGYRALFAALKTLAIRNLAAGGSAEWRSMFRPVFAKASLEPKITALHAADLYELFAEFLYDEDVTPTEAGLSSLNYSVSDPEAPHVPLVIPFDPRFVDFDPARDSGQLSAPFYEQTYRPFLTNLAEAIKLEI